MYFRVGIILVEDFFGLDKVVDYFSPSIVEYFFAVHKFYGNFNQRLSGVACSAYFTVDIGSVVKQEVDFHIYFAYGNAQFNRGIGTGFGYSVDKGRNA